MKKILVVSIQCSHRVYIFQQVEIRFAIAHVIGCEGFRQWFAKSEVFYLKFEIFFANHFQSFIISAK